MRLIEDVDATGGRKILRSAYIWYRFTIIVARDSLGLPLARTVSRPHDRNAGPTTASNRDG